jgi:hypothetical protein
MSQYKIDFESLEWQELLPGARAKIYREGPLQLRIVEFTSEFVEPHWCEKGHTGFVLSGILEVDFKGYVITFPQGSGINIRTGSSSAHKARAVTSVVRLALVEDTPLT